MKSEKTKTTSEKKLEAFNDIFGMITHDEAEEIRSDCGLYFREVKCYIFWIQIY